jgi:hypothetical protein
MACVSTPKFFPEETFMRIALTLMLLVALAATANADTGRRSRWRNTPARTWRLWNGYNTSQPGWDSTYYSPYTTGNTVDSTQLGTTTPTPTPANGQWQTETFNYAAPPTSNWTPGPTPEPTPATSPTNTQTYQPIPHVTSDAIPTNNSTTIPGTTTTNQTRRPTSSSASFQLPTPQTNYWNTLNGANK